jgi:UDP-glucuronate 4-epimerase
VRETWANIDKAKELIDWEPQISLEEGLDLSVEWYRQNQEMACSLDLQV